MKHDLRKIAARQAAQAITVGILMDQVRLMREAVAFMGRSLAALRRRRTRSSAIVRP